MKPIQTIGKISVSWELIVIRSVSQSCMLIGRCRARDSIVCVQLLSSALNCLFVCCQLNVNI